MLLLLNYKLGHRFSQIFGYLQLLLSW